MLIQPNSLSKLISHHEETSNKFISFGTNENTSSRGDGLLSSLFSGEKNILRYIDKLENEKIFLIKNLQKKSQKLLNKKIKSNSIDYESTMSYNNILSEDKKI